MIIFPAIDLKNGKCVRLEQGKFDNVKVFNEDPVAVAKEFEAKGAEYIHLVDLDGAVEGELVNRTVIENIVKSVKIPCELGGGIRTIERIEELLNLGLARVILGTIAIKNPELTKEAVAKFGGEKVVIGIDAKKGKVAINGWLDVTEKDVVELIKEMESIGVKTVIYTDIEKDGMMQGISLDSVKRILEQTDINMVVSGGVTSIEDINHLVELKNSKIEGVITGKAIYEGKLNLEEAIRVAK
jgi:phosphoribosylformimino-5-aminoimidazole carboxamide ribotide isomerase